MVDRHVHASGLSIVGSTINNITTDKTTDPPTPATTDPTSRRERLTLLELEPKSIISRQHHANVAATKGKALSQEHKTERLAAAARSAAMIEMQDANERLAIAASFVAAGRIKKWVDSMKQIMKQPPEKKPECSSNRILLQPLKTKPSNDKIAITNLSTTRIRKPSKKQTTKTRTMKEEKLFSQAQLYRKKLIQPLPLCSPRAGLLRISIANQEELLGPWTSKEDGFQQRHHLLMPLLSHNYKS